MEKSLILRTEKSINSISRTKLDSVVLKITVNSGKTFGIWLTAIKESTISIYKDNGDDSVGELINSFKSTNNNRIEVTIKEGNYYAIVNNISNVTILYCNTASDNGAGKALCLSTKEILNSAGYNKEFNLQVIYLFDINENENSDVFLNLGEKISSPTEIISKDEVQGLKSIFLVNPILTFIESSKSGFSILEGSKFETNDIATIIENSKFETNGTYELNVFKSNIYINGKTFSYTFNKLIVTDDSIIIAKKGSTNEYTNVLKYMRKTRQWIEL